MTQCTLISKKTGKKYYFRSGNDASRFLGYSRSYINAAILSGKAIRHKKTGECFSLEYNRIAYGSQGDGMGSRPHIQPCSLCEKFAGGCIWSRDFEPIEGWEAEPTVIGKDSYPIHSYRITYCPEFKEG